MAKENTETAKSTGNRRDFMKLAALGTVSSGAALLASSDKAEAVEVKSPSSVGYRETKHVQEYYRTARF